MNDSDPLDGDDELEPDDRTADPGTERTFHAEPVDAGHRLDRFLSDACPDLSRNRVQALIRDGMAANAGRTVSEASYRVKPGDVFTLTIPSAAPADPIAQNIPLNVVYEDEHLIVVDKPAGMVVHPAPGSPDGTLVNALLYHCGDSLAGIGGVQRPGIVHRIDKDTSGLLVVAKTDPAHAGLAALFAEHDIERRYRALVWGSPTPSKGRIEGNIGRDPKDRKKMAIQPATRGKPAVSHYQTIRARGRGAALVECSLETGRTHQIRIHMASIGNPLIGDPLYCRISKARRQALAGIDAAALEGALAFPRQALHAAVLGFRHPIDRRSLLFETQPPEDFLDLHAALGLV